ncbi:hypothetical protein GTY65_10415 [Streptomyces sp. SID8379]|uniref:DUF6801 domain-containing protein n=1 Tax=unclassified Streptomyces TaxID=2593676 RepID=UPI00047560EF|nr:MULTISPECIES: DUF6801 domain-containing protein [unclassified Streptomyces]MYW64479.1 hypothetical protein [Streptomyces sp. SID8379]
MRAIDKRTGPPARRSVRVASVASAALVAGLLSGSGSRADEQPPSAVELAYECGLPATAGTDGTAVAKLAATVKVSTQLPTTAVTGQPIQAGPVQVEAVLPRAGLADLLPAGGDLTSEATLGVEVRQNGEKADATWSGLSGRATMPSDGTDLVLPHTGDVSSITVDSPGDIELVAGDLALTVTPSTGTAVAVTCSPAKDTDPLMARVAVPGGAETEPGGSPSSSTEPGEGKHGSRDGLTVTPKEQPKAADVTCGERPTGEPDLSQLPPPPAPPEVNHSPGFGGCAYAAGLATVRKQNGSMIINDPSRTPALMNISGGIRGSNATNPNGNFWNSIDSIGRLTLPDSESTFLAFGFTPVSAKVGFDTGLVSISTGNTDGISGAYAVITFFQTIHIRSAKVNGTPLAVGSNCRTKEPFRVTLRGSINDDGTGSYTHVLFGGLLTGKVTIPAFTGCGTGGENLSPLFTASISGPDNLIAMNQAPVCAPEYSLGCPPVMATLPPTKLP